MKISYNWLKDYIQTDLPAEEAGVYLTNTGLEVEGIDKVQSITGGLEGVVIGEVVEKWPHENADRLNVTKVDIGSGDLLQIVCGAPNVEKGQKVLVAKVGATLYPSPTESFPIKKAKIRGVESSGMICAEDELGIGESHDGIMVLPTEAKIGMPAGEYFNVKSDNLIEIGLTPNRTDALGHIGVARDLKAALNVLEDKQLELTLPKLKNVEVKPSSKITLKVQDFEACPYYSGLVIENLNNLETPEWMKERLNLIGQKSINAVVDITNYVMFEYGQPLHAFDLNDLKGNVVVRKANKGEKLTTLDEIERDLSADDLMICNASESMCIGGVFGGLNSGVKESTTSIFLEGAYFNPVSVRKTAKRHGLSTDSSFRFERGVDPQKVNDALFRAAQLIQEICGGEIEGIVKDGHAPTAQQVDFNFDRCRRIIGDQISDERIAKILAELEFNVISDSEESWVLSIPTYRVDVTREIDVIEEVLRIHGFNNIPIPEKLNASISYRPKPNKETIYNAAANFLVDNGFNEIMNNSLTAYSDAENAVELLNPLSQELKHMRTELLSGGLKNIAYNQNRQHPNLKFFEFGKTYQIIKGNYIEKEEIGLWMTGSLNEENWNQSNESVSFYTIFGIVKSLGEKLGVQLSLEEKNEIFIIKSGKKVVGNINIVDKKTLKSFGIRNPVFYANLNWKEIINFAGNYNTKAKALPKTPFVRRDFSLLLDDSITFDAIRKLAFRENNVILKKVGLFDVYEGKNLEKGKKSYAVSFYFQDFENTLKDDEVDAIMNGIRSKLEGELKAELR